MELLPEEERVNAFRVKMHLPQLQEFALVAADEEVRWASGQGQRVLAGALRLASGLGDMLC